MGVEFELGPEVEQHLERKKKKQKREKVFQAGIFTMSKRKYVCSIFRGRYNE